MTFICWNRFLDLADAIDKGAASVTKNKTEFAETDLPNTWILSQKLKVGYHKNVKT